DFLPDCLQSIVNQSVTEWELLAVNDFSTDQSLDILNHFAQKDPRIRVLENDRKGIAPALRMAYQNSVGTLLTRMDADDLMPPRKLEWLRDVLVKKGPGHIATGKVRYFSETGLREGYRRYEKWLNELTRTHTHYREIYRECVLPSPNWMAFREDLETCGAFRSDVYPEDYDLCFRFYAQGFRIVGAQEVTHLWRDHAERTSRTSPIYANNQYFELKIPRFLQLDYDPSRPLVLWGAGRKGKQIARILNQHHITFSWVTNNAKKWGVRLSGATLSDFQTILRLERPFILLAVAAPGGVVEIKRFLSRYNFEPARDFFWF
ncbi:MAG: glycosyltransferase family 2 protein, partial [Bacteroidetes bacterium]